MIEIAITTLNLGNASKSSEEMRSILDAVFSEIPVIGSDRIRIHCMTSDEPATALKVNLLTNYVDSTTCVLHTLLLFANDVLQDSSQL